MSVPVLADGDSTQKIKRNNWSDGRLKGIGARRKDSGKNISEKKIRPKREGIKKKGVKGRLHVRGG